MSQPKLYFVTSNEEKFREIHGALVTCPVRIERVGLDISEIQSIDPAEVAAHKARQAYQQLGGGWTMVEDSGLGIDAWRGYPGALVKWVEQAVGERGLCRQLDGWNERGATATVALCLYDGIHSHTFVGQTHGYIVQEPRGEFGFGWDSIFQPAGYPITYGEMPREEKKKISMRALALAKLQTFLMGI